MSTVERWLSDNPFPRPKGTYYSSTGYEHKQYFSDVRFLRKGVSTKSANYTATIEDDVILCDSSGGAFTILLPSAATVTGKIITIKMVGAGANAVTLDGADSETIDGGTTDNTIDAQYDFLTIYCDGTNWHIIGKALA